MSTILPVDTLHSLAEPYDVETAFKRDIQTGLSGPYKQIQSKYFYDELGSEIFNKITNHPDYYLTQCELEIFSNCKCELSNYLNEQPFNLIELGPGEGIKTKILLEQFLQGQLKFRYTPIDISSQYLKILVKKFTAEFADIQINPIHGDFFKSLKWQSDHSHRQNLVLFLGSSIGNFDPAYIVKFLTYLKNSLHPGDFVLIGFDLKKDIDILLKAYDDNDGLTKEFNLNLLRRINRELGGEFNLDKFKHYATYNVFIGAMESYLISQSKQKILIKNLEQTFSFNPLESVHVEYSFKFDLLQIEEFARRSGFKLVENFIDEKKYFVDSLWQVK